jgi:phosphatidylinositol alpha-1,6-mannosyltransferase
VWPIKNGKIVYTAPNDPRVIATRALFTHSHFPIIGGLLKGWMPSFPLVLWRLRKRTALVFSCSEPVLLTTLYQAVFTKLLGKKHVCASWENIPPEEKLHGLSRWVHLLIIRANLALSDAIVCGNKESEQIYRCYTKKSIAQFVLNGVDPEQFQRTESPKSFQGHDLSGFVVYTFIGAIEHRKGMQVVVRAFPRVLQAVPNARLVIAGTGPDEPELQEEIKRAGIQDKLIRVPWLDDAGVRSLMNVSGVFVYPGIPYRGWVEQFGFAMLEASLMELPVIGTTAGSTPQAVLHEKTGILIRPDDVGELEDAMIRLGTNGFLRQQLGNAGRQYIMSHFSNAIVARKFHEFFKSLL